MASNKINKFEIKIRRKRDVRAGKGFNLFISYEDINDMIKIIKSLQDTNVLLDGINEIVKHKTKKQEGGFLSALLIPLTPSLVQSLNYSVVKGISGRGIRKEGREYMNKSF